MLMTQGRHTVHEIAIELSHNVLAVVAAGLPPVNTVPWARVVVPNTSNLLKYEDDSSGIAVKYARALPTELLLLLTNRQSSSLRLLRSSTGNAAQLYTNYYSWHGGSATIGSTLEHWVLGGLPCAQPCLVVWYAVQVALHAAVPFPCTWPFTSRHGATWQCW